MMAMADIVAMQTDGHKQTFRPAACPVFVSRCARAMDLHTAVWVYGCTYTIVWFAEANMMELHDAEC